MQSNNRTILKDNILGQKQKKNIKKLCMRKKVRVNLR